MLTAASEARFEVFVTIDKQLEHQQNLGKPPLPIILVDGTSNTLPCLEPFAPYLRIVLAPLKVLVAFADVSGLKLCPALINVKPPSETA